MKEEEDKKGNKEEDIEEINQEEKDKIDERVDRRTEGGRGW